MIAWLIIVGLIGTGILLDRNGTLRRKGWRIYFDRLSCPLCKTRPPLVRIGRSSREFTWGEGWISRVGGGWTCRVCGAEVDNWGHLLSTPASAGNKGSANR
jgi:rubredoxin